MVIAILAVPMMIWNVLPEDHAISFITYVDSVNLLGSREELDMQMVLRAAKGQPVDDGHDINVYSQRR